MSDDALVTLVMTIVAADDAAVFRMLARDPALARTHFKEGATHQAARIYQIDEIGHYIYGGDTALHLAAAAYRQDTARQLLALGASVHAANRRGAEPLHSRLMACQGRVHGTLLLKQRLSSVSSKRVLIQMPAIKAERPRCIAPCARVAPQP